MAASGGSSVSLNEMAFSKIANAPGAELPYREMAVTLVSVVRLVNPLLFAYQACLGTLTRPRAVGEHSSKKLQSKVSRGLYGCLS